MHLLSTRLASPPYGFAAITPIRKRILVLMSYFNLELMEVWNTCLESRSAAIDLIMKKWKII
jgi:hypothetical protein